jgi:hypothetical protein
LYWAVVDALWQLLFGVAATAYGVVLSHRAVTAVLMRHGMRGTAQVI